VSGPGDTDNARFKIVGSTLQVNKQLNYEQQQSYRIRIQANDGRVDGTSAEAFTIMATNRNDPPSNLALTAQAIAENQAAPTTVGVLSSQDEDVGETLTYALVEGAGSSGNSMFQITGNELYSRQPLDYEQNAVYQVRIEVRDRASTAVSTSFNIAVTNMNDQPRFTSIPVEVSHLGDHYTYQIETSDQDMSDTHQITPAGELPAWLTLTDEGDGTALLQGQPTSADIGTYPIALVVHDAQGASSLQQFDLQVVSTATLSLIFTPIATTP
jgi:hypothetical protein